MNRLFLLCLLSGVAVGQIYNPSSTTPANGTANSYANVINVKAAPYNAVGDAQAINDGVSTNASGVLTSATANWQTTDVGKLIYCTRSDTGNGNYGASLTTIASRQSATQVTLAATASTSISGNLCVWATADDTAAFTAALTAASPVTNARNARQYPIYGSGKTVYIPAGGYLVTNRIFYWEPASSRSLAPSLIGEDWDKVNIYLPGQAFQSNAGVTGGLINLDNSSGWKVGGFTVNGLKGKPNLTGGAPLILFGAGENFLVENLHVQDVGGSGSNVAVAANSLGSGVMRNIYIQGSSVAGAMGSQFSVNGSQFAVEQFVFSNNGTGRNLQVTNDFNRNPVAGHMVFLSGLVDECGSTDACTVVTGSNAEFYSTNHWGGQPKGAFYVTGNSQVFINNAAIGEFNSTNNATGMFIDAGSTAYVTDSTIWGVGTGVALNNAGTFQDVGGNQFQHCSNSTCPAATLAQSYTGTAPVASLTHSANTFVLGGTLAAATFGSQTPDQSILITKLQAISTTSTTCASAPVVTFTNGSTSSTLTLTTGKTQWDSSVDASSGLPQQLVGGTAFTAAVTAGTCATPPTNLNVTYTWQSLTAP